MSFTPDERAALLAAPLVGPTVLARFEEIGFGSAQALAGAEPDHICRLVAAHLGTTCWANAPRARQSVANAIAAAQALLAARDLRA
ncbi:hypothetical protein [Paenirhodobacter sp. CAU 1674]|uniref:hypothetical protein n=1 Tax=Paenirhodobacter sp. CAU 1674 TaxID=3032596 RepID=UPI0023D9CBCA|nr:hypothetical protein [Paenirhodobacter sp. CAU 1674]MDF2141149.1 hypothetical protein [Paenirhodobacter sp. CAU 1674]